MDEQGSFRFEENDSTDDIRRSLPKEVKEKVAFKFAELLYKSILKPVEKKYP